MHRCALVIEIHGLNRASRHRFGPQQTVAFDLPGVPHARLVSEQFKSAESMLLGDEFTAIRKVDDGPDGAVRIHRHTQETIVHHAATFRSARRRHGMGRISFREGIRFPCGAIHAELADGAGNLHGFTSAQVIACALCNRLEPCQIAAIVLAGLAVDPGDGRSRQDVMELIQQQCAPDVVQLLPRIRIVGVTQRCERT